MANKTKKILDQCLDEMEFARKHKRGRLEQWRRTEKQYYDKAPHSNLDSRSDVRLPKMQGFVNTLLSKIDAPPKINYKPGEASDYKAALRLNALKDQDERAQNGNWAFKDLMGKKQAILYGRAVYEYHASSKGGYQSHLTLVDVYDFLIDPNGGGLDIENAEYLGRGFYKQGYELRDGIKNKGYISSATNRLLKQEGGETNDEEEQAKENRYVAMMLDTKRIINNDIFKLWEWYTTYEGQRYYVLLSEQGKEIVKLKKLEEVFKSGKYPFWTWATSPDAFEFWTPSPCDEVREIFQAQDVTINQAIDNTEEINKPMKYFDVNAVENPALLKYRKDGLVPMDNKVGRSINNMIQIERPTSIETPLKLYEVLDTIQQQESGVTSDMKGSSDEDKVGIYEGNLANTADRLGLDNKSYSNGYNRFAMLYLDGVKEHLSKPMAIKMIGEDGVELDEIKRKDVNGTYGEFDIIVESSDAEIQSDLVDKKNKLQFLAQNAQNPVLNPKKAIEIGARIAGFSDDQIDELMDTETYGNAALLSEASRDIQRILHGEVPEPNANANAAYVQKLVDYLRDKGENMKEDQILVLSAYIEEVMQVVPGNMVKAAGEQIAKEGNLNAPGTPPATGVAPPEVPLEPGAEPIENNTPINAI